MAYTYICNEKAREQNWKSNNAHALYVCIVYYEPTEGAYTYTHHCYSVFMFVSAQLSQTLHQIWL